VVLINTDYVVLLSHGLPEGIVAEIPIPELSPLMNGYIVAVYGTANHPALQPLLIVGYPYRFNNQVAGAALVGISMAELENAFSGVNRTITIALAITALLTSILIYISNRAISKPLRQANLMAETLQEQERIRSSFIANISHDIRSPLTSMRGFLTAIQDGTVSPKQQPYYLNIILDESERLIKLSNDLINLQQIQDAELKLEKTTFDINDLIRKTILGFEARALEKRLMITSKFAHPSDIVLADEDKIRRCLYNLIDNAVKFTDENGEIIIETSVKQDKVLISVSDNGIGIPSEEQNKIFDRFYKSDSSRGEDKLGSGLGLYIVKSFLRAHGENISVESMWKTGTLFTFTLPLAVE